MDPRTDDGVGDGRLDGAQIGITAWRRAPRIGKRLKNPFPFEFRKKKRFSQKIYSIKNSAPFFRLFGKGALRIFYREVSREKIIENDMTAKRVDVYFPREFCRERYWENKAPKTWLFSCFTGIFFESVENEALRRGLPRWVLRKIIGKGRKKFLKKILTPLYFCGLRALSAKSLRRLILKRAKYRKRYPSDLPRVRSFRKYRRNTSYPEVR